MPFDDIPEVPDLTKPSLEALRYLLRNKDLWPTHFKQRGWDHSSFQTCAVGLIRAQWPEHVSWGVYFDNEVVAGGLIGISKEDSIAAFLNARTAMGKRLFEPTTPEDVADYLDTLTPQHVAPTP